MINNSLADIKTWKGLQFVCFTSTQPQFPLSSKKKYERKPHIIKKVMGEERKLYGYETADPIKYGILKICARENRKHQTKGEKLLWDKLRKNKYGFNFRRQHIIDVFIADFVHLPSKLIIEIDGGYHSESEQIENDNIRTDILSDMGFKVIRFTNEEVEKCADDVAESIYNAIFSLQNLFG